MTTHHDLLLARLDEHQAKAMEILGRGSVLLAVDAVPNPQMLVQSRWELTRILGAYQAFKHHELFDPILRSGPPDKAKIAAQMKAECTALGKEFREHVARCTNLDIPAHWDSYRPAVAKLVARLKAHMLRERWVVAGMLLKPEIVAPMRAAG